MQGIMTINVCYQSKVVNHSLFIKIASVHLVLKFDCLNATLWQEMCNL